MSEICSKAILILLLAAFALQQEQRIYGSTNLGHCGNAKVEAQDGQKCDDGNTQAGDGCGSQCIVERGWSCQGGNPNSPDSCSRIQTGDECGNGQAKKKEQCDDGNTASGDGCSQYCFLEPDFTCSTNNNQPTSCTRTGEGVCGNGIKEESIWGQQCDDGTPTGGDGCGAQCLVEDGWVCIGKHGQIYRCYPIDTCGNEIVEEGEDCQPPNTETCDSNCQDPVDPPPAASSCGNNVLEFDEDCQPPNTAICDQFCLDIPPNPPGGGGAVCGNYIVETGEDCQPPNTAICDQVCLDIPPNPPGGGGATCGNNVVEAGQDCQPPNTAVCDEACFDIPPNPPGGGGAICGNNIIETDEDCEPPNTAICDEFCLDIPPGPPGGGGGFCGDFSIDAGEDCDPPNTAVCDALCQDIINLCGNGFINLGEDCQPPNTAICDNLCQDIISPPGGAGFCGDGLVGAGEQCQPPSTSTCNSLCLTITPLCGNGILNIGEQCQPPSTATCDSQCQTVLSPGAGLCGNGVVNAGEQCEPPNTLTCNSQCRFITSLCGNGVIDAGQTCEPPNTSICTSNCLTRVLCGNGIRDVGQQCDNGEVPNSGINDGCNAQCRIDPDYECSGAIGQPSRCVRKNYCGNSLYQPYYGEECDNGPLPGCDDNCQIVDGWTCTRIVLQASDCTPETVRPDYCGDGKYMPYLGEECDDGNLLNSDGCSRTCKIEPNYNCRVLPIGSRSTCTMLRDRCGNGVLETGFGQACDDGNQASFDGCSSSCQVENGYQCVPQGQGSRCILVTPQSICGNGYYQPSLGQQCDDGGNRPYDGCSTNCQIEFGWECTHIGYFPLSKCTRKCGNGRLEAGFREVCDDGNYYDHDGCDGTCQVESGWTCTSVPNAQSSCQRVIPSGYCGDGLIQSPESCDDGGIIPGDGCNGACTIQFGWNCNGAPSRCFRISRCGNGLVQNGEQCDDGFNQSNDGCSATCRVQPGWSCSTNSQGRSVCQPQGTCGDGVFNPVTEQCDDGTIGGNDGCVSCRVSVGWQCYRNVPFQLSLCRRTSQCGNGVVELGEQCDDGNNVNTDACDNSCIVRTPQRCGNGRFEPQNFEQCDDGNNVPFDGCSQCNIEPNWECSNVLLARSVCNRKCGNGRLERAEGEACDTGIERPNDGCTQCRIDSGWTCPINNEGQLSVCEKVNPCGNGIFEPELGETCDDGNNDDNDGCMRCVKNFNSQCFQTPAGPSVCNFPFYCRYTDYNIRYIPLTQAAKNALAGSVFQGAQTASDIVQLIVYFDAVTSYVRTVFYTELERLLKARNLWAQWGVISIQIHKCTGYTQY